MALLALLVAQHLVEAAPQELVLLLAPYGDVRCCRGSWFC